MTGAVEAWAIRAPDGEIFISTLTPDKYISIRDYSPSAEDWQRKLDAGYGCIRVLVTPLEAKER